MYCKGNSKLCFFEKNRWFYYHTLVESPLGGDECALKIWGYYSDRVPKWQKVVLKVMKPILCIKKCLVCT